MRHNPNITKLVFANVGLACLVLAGCAGAPDDMPDLGQVEGHVLLDGAALPGAKVTFQPENGRPSTAITEEDGYFKLMYIDQPGAKVGKHTVRISKKEVERDKQGEILSSEETVPAKFNTQSTLTREVKPGDNESMEFDLKSKG